MSLQSRSNADADDFFQIRESAGTSILPDRGKLRSGTKSDILGCLPGMPGPGQNPAVREASAVACSRHGCSSPYHQAPAGQRVWGVHRNAIATVPREPYDGQSSKVRCHLGHR